MSASQAALTAAIRYLEQPRRGVGRPSKNNPPVGISREALAQESGVGKALLDEAIRVVETLREHDKERLEKLERGVLVVGRVYDEIVRTERRAELLANVAQPPDGKYDIILADPPWQYDDDGVGRRGAAEDHYPTTSLSDLMAMRPMVDEIAAEDSILLMWAVSPLLPDALRLVEAWGFVYHSFAVWHKTGRIGMGSIFRIDHEPLIVAKRGAGVHVDDHGVRSVIAAPVSAHSVKPEASYDAIKRLWFDAKKIELFARRARGGWRAWGAEAPTDADVA